MRAMTLAKTQLKEVFNQPIAWIVLFVMPIALIGFLLYGLEHVIKSKSLLPPFDVAIVDADDTEGTRQLIQQFKDNGELISFRVVDEVKANTLIEENKIAAILKVPEGFTDGIRDGDNKQVTVIGNNQRPFQSALFNEMMNSSADLVSAAQSGVNTIYDYMVEVGHEGEYLQRVADIKILEFTSFAFNRKSMFDKSEVNAFEGVTPLKYYSTSGIIFLLLLTGLLTMSLTSSTKDKIDERLRTFGVSTISHVSSAFITTFVILFMQAMLLLSGLFLLTEVSVTGHWGWSIVAIITMIIAISVWYTFLSNLPIPSGIQFFVGLIGIMVFTASGSLLFPEAYYTGFLEWVNLSTLTHWIHTMFIHALFVYNKEIILASIGVLGGMTGLLFSSSLLLRQVRRI
ncbi:ABC transporter permease [Pseudalkalibacillus berkeleyi]|uniref:ABC transporter permease n=1 Tax=Pseudalkalibacillus berkeleyi TaxID=1069813 RepID=A0ABS9H4H7_9BACL|nr:ABC transporter permease [Pseudalkalibacillus berkeleyi]MCF6138798.1 ABC transporter permease [Pseudalkalibacillus berkeleyi]